MTYTGRKKGGAISRKEFIKIVTGNEFQTTQGGKLTIDKGYNPRQIIATANKPPKQPIAPINLTGQQQPATQPIQGNAADKK